MKNIYPESYSEYFQAAGILPLQFSEEIWSSRQDGCIVESLSSADRFDTFTLDLSCICYEMGEDDYRIQIDYDKVDDCYNVDFWQCDYTLKSKLDLIKFLIGFCKLEGLLKVED